MALCAFYHKLPDEILDTTWAQFQAMTDHMIEAQRAGTEYGG